MTSKRSFSEAFKAVSSWNMSYEEARIQGKIGNLVAAILLFKSCVSLGIFTFPYVFGRVGYILGTVLSLFVCYLSTYGMWLMADLTNRLESEMHRSQSI